MEKLKIAEILVVEGRDDFIRVKEALDCECIITNGFHLRSKTINQIRTAAKTVGIIVLTDPDTVGEQIRDRIEKLVDGSVKHAFISADDANQDGDIGVENASPEAIRAAVLKCREYQRYTSGKDTNADSTLDNKLDNSLVNEKSLDITRFDNLTMLKYGLSGDESSKVLRNLLGRELGIGYANSKRFLKRLNQFGISFLEFETAYQKVIAELK